MRLFRALGTRSKAGTYNGGVPREVLPELNAFVDVALGKNYRRESISIDAIGSDTFTVRMIPGLRIGCSADFLYRNSVGQFRFTTVCTGFDESEARFTLPAAVETIAVYGAKRASVRVESMRLVFWRYAPGGMGNGEFSKASMNDLSRAGASLVVGRELRTGTQVEVRFALKTTSKPLVMLSEVVRAAKIETSGKNLVGIRFVNVDGSVERAINEFIHERQMLRRDRGMV